MLISNVVVDWLNNTLHAFLLLLDQVVYWAASQCYQLFIKLSATRLFDDAFFANFANRIYAILGIFMLFYLAYALLNAIIDPEKLAKGDKGVSKIATNLVVSLVILGFLPTIFSYAYRMQNYMLSSNIIGSLVLGTPTMNVEDSQDTMIRYGDAISFTVLNTFLNPENENFTIGANYSWWDFKDDVLNNSDYSSLPAMNKAVSTGAVTENGNSKRISYTPIISTAAGIFLVYVMLSFTIDLGIRVVKFAVYQLLAPIPIIMRVVPGKKATFDKWLKQTLSVYFEVFVRVGIMYIAIYFINELANNANLQPYFGSESGIQGKLAFVVIIMGILAFAKQAPKMISDILGIETSGMKLGLTEKLKAGGFFTGGAMVGAGLTGFAQGLTGGIGNVWSHGKNSYDAFKNNEIKKGLLQAGSALLGLGTGALSSLASPFSSGYNVYKNKNDIKGFKDMTKASSAGAKTTLENRRKRANYIAANNGLVGAATAKFMEGASIVTEWATGSGFNAGILDKIKYRDDLKKVYDGSYKELFNTPKYQNLDSLKKQYEAQREAGFTTVNGQPNGQSIQDAIDNLEAQMKASRLKTISDNRDATSYAAYSIAQFMKQNATETKNAKFTLNGIDPNDIVLKENHVQRKSTGQDLTELELRQIFESVDANGDPLVDSQGNVLKGVMKQVTSLTIENKGLKQSVEYKEYQRKEEAKKNNK